MIVNVSVLDVDYKELLQGCAGYIEDEKRDAMYKLALRLASSANWKPDELAEGIGVLLLTWNAAFYTKYGSFNFDSLELFIKKNLEELKTFSKRNILSYATTDDEPVQRLFDELMEATSSIKRSARTPVGTAKALHLLAPDFFSIWDNTIARKYGVHWSVDSSEAPQLYVRFQNLTNQLARNILASYERDRHVSSEVSLQQLCMEWHPKVATAIYNLKPPMIKSLVKMIDEYNYAKYRLKLDLTKYEELVSRVLSSNQNSKTSEQSSHP